MITGDYQLMFEDYYTGDMLTLGGDDQFCSVRFDGIGSAELRTSERDMPSEDGVTFGYEYLGKRQWTISGAIKSGTMSNVPGDSSGAWDSLSQLMRAWDHNRARLSARDVLPLYFKRPGRDMMLVYGRPERIDPDVTQSYAGFVTYQAAFRQSDPKFYSNEVQTMSLTTAQAPSGGVLLTDMPGDSLGTMTNALKVPLTTVGTVDRAGAMVQGGDVPSSPVIEITVPPGATVTNPTVVLLNADTSIRWSMTLATTVQSNQTVTIDPRLWARSVVRNDGASLAGAYRGPRLAELVVPPGPAEFIYRGSGTGSSSTCTIQLRNAWAAV